MSNRLWKTLLVSPLVVGTSISGAVTEAFAQDEQSILEQAIEYSTDTAVEQEFAEEETEQVTSVSQLRDVRPTDWAFQALQSLVERYGCIAGYPNGTFRGNRSITRYEFAAGLNSCLDRVNELIAAASANAASREDLAVLQRLQEEFAAELATLRGRVDALEARTTELEANQFSTTTKLVGEAIFAVTDAWNGDLHPNNARFNVGSRRAILGASSTFDGANLNDLSGYSADNETAFMGRVRLNLNTSFGGKDLLLTRIQAQSTDLFNFQNDSGIGLQTYQANEAFDNNQVYLDKLQYYWSYNNRFNFVLSADGGTFDDFVPTLNPYFEDYDGGNGSLNAFSQRNPIYRIGGGAGLGVDVNVGDFKFLNLGAVNLSFGMLQDDLSNPGRNDFGDYGLLAQLTVTPSQRFSFAFTYANGYHTENEALYDNGYGYDLVSTPQTSLLSNIGRTSTNSYGGALSWRVSPKFVVNGFMTYTNAQLLTRGSRGSGDIWTYAVNMAFPDLFRPGNVGGLSVGVPPYLAGVTLAGKVENDTPINIEGFYKMRVSDNISITPGFTVLIDPFQGALDEDTIVVGTLRTTFSF